MSDYYITKEGYDKLYQSYLNMDKEIGEVTKMMGESAKRDSDLRENPEFMQLRVKSMYELPQQKQLLLKKYEAAIIIEETAEYKEFDGKTVIRGSKIKINIDEDEICEYTILGTDEGDINNDILSCDAPMVKALLGSKVGTVVEYQGMDIEILEVEKLLK